MVKNLLPLLLFRDEDPLKPATPAEDVQSKKPSLKEMLFKNSSPITSFQNLAKKVPVETGARSKLKINLPNIQKTVFTGVFSKLV